MTTVYSPCLPCQRLVAVIGICLISFIVAGCNKSDSTRPPDIRVVEDDVPALPAGQIPAPPLVIPEPKAPRNLSDGRVRPSDLDERTLQSFARREAEKGNLSEAANLQHWAVLKSGKHQYNLACFLALANRKEDAFYWLQMAAKDEGVDAAWAEEDGDLVSLQSDERWPQVRRFLRQYEKYWASKQIVHPVLLLPKDYDGKTPLTTIVCLHGLGSNPENIASEAMQPFADELQIAIVGINGTVPRGKTTFVWSEDPEADHQQVVRSLDSLAGKFVPAPGKVIAIGFSQGAQAGLEAAVRHPEYYAGAIVISPGNRTGSGLAQVQPSPELAKRAFVFVVGAQEHPGNVALTAQDAQWARNAKAHVVHRPTPGQSQHSFPADFNERFPEWVRMIEKTGGK